MGELSTGGLLPKLAADGELDFGAQLSDSGSETLSDGGALEKAHTVYDDAWVALRAAVAEAKGMRPTMEDAFCVTGDDEETAWLFGVFDGHGGKACSQFVARAFERRFDGGFRPHYDEAIEELCLKVDRAFLQEAEEKDDGDESGSTATFAFLMRCGRAAEYVAHVGNVGDSRVLLYERAANRTVPLTEDHKPSNATERARIQAAGGWVAMDRVNGRLGVARAFGDMYYKTGKEPRKQKVVAVPDVTTATVRPGDVLLLCCDGVVEEMDNDAAMSVALQHLAARPVDVAGAARAVCDAALERGSTDNCTALVVSVAAAPAPFTPPTAPTAERPAPSALSRDHGSSGSGKEPDKTMIRPSFVKTPRAACDPPPPPESVVTAAAAPLPSTVENFSPKAAKPAAPPANSVRNVKSSAGKSAAAPPPQASPRSLRQQQHLISVSLVAHETDFGMRLETCRTGGGPACKIKEVDRDGPAWRAHLRAGMLITSLDAKAAASHVTVERRMRAVALTDRADRRVELMVLSSGPLSWAKVRRGVAAATPPAPQAAPLQRSASVVGKAPRRSASIRSASTAQQLPPSNAAASALHRRPSASALHRRPSASSALHRRPSASGMRRASTPASEPPPSPLRTLTRSRVQSMSFRGVAPPAPEVPAPSPRRPAASPRLQRSGSQPCRPAPAPGMHRSRSTPSRKTSVSASPHSVGGASGVVTRTASLRRGARGNQQQQQQQGVDGLASSLVNSSPRPVPAIVDAKKAGARSRKPPSKRSQLP